MFYLYLSRRDYVTAMQDTKLCLCFGNSVKKLQEFLRIKYTCIVHFPKAWKYSRFFQIFSSIMVIINCHMSFLLTNIQHQF